MASTLYISLPSKVVAQNRPDWTGEPLAFALLSDEGRLMQQGRSNLTDLRVLAVGARQVAFLVAANDTSLLTAKVPPMSAAKLKQALPNLLEDQLIGDPTDLILVSTTVADGEVSVAVVDRHWLEELAKKVKDWPVKKVSAYPAQLALAFHAEAGAVAETATAVIDSENDALEICVRNGVRHGLGLNLDRMEPTDVLAIVTQLSKAAHAICYVPPADLEAYQLALKAASLEGKVQVMPCSWIHRVEGVADSTPDLMTGVSAEHMASFDWSQWRWGLRLALILLAVNLFALNFEWFGMKREADEINKSLNQVYRNTYPKETVIVDPLKQMEQKVNAAKRAAGRFAANDFAVLASQFAQVWDRVGVPGGVASIEYKELSLFVRLKPNTQISMDVLSSALAEQSLQIKASGDGMLRVSTGGKN